MAVNIFLRTAAAAFIAFALCGLCGAQTGNVKSDQKAALSPQMKQIDLVGLKALLKPNGKPLLVNFWATWCDPCREEFPDLVKIDEEFKGKIDLITISFDDLADIKTHVPKFLQDMDAKMPAFLLHTPNESAAISMVSKNWKGNLPMTVLFNSDGSISYERNGKIRPEILRENIRNLLTAEQAK